MTPFQAKIITGFMNYYGSSGIKLHVTPAGTATACIPGKFSVMVAGDWSRTIQYHMFDHNRGWIKHRRYPLPAIIHEDGRREYWEHGEPKTGHSACKS